MAGLNIPANAQPQDIGSPIPGGGEGQTLSDVLGKFHPLANTQQAQGRMPAGSGPTLAQTLPSMAPQNPMMAQADPSQPTPDQVSQAAAAGADAKPDYDRDADTAMASIWDSIPADQKDAAKAQDHDAAVKAIFDEHVGDDQTDGAPAWVRFLGAMPKTNVGRLDMFKKIYGADNARFEGGQFQYKTDSKSDNWHSVSPDGIDWASKGPDALEGMAGTAVGAGLTAGSDMLIGPKTGQAVGWGLASVARNAANQAMGVQEAADFSQTKDALTSAGLGAAFSGITSAANKLIIQPIANVIRDSLSNRMAAAAAIRGAVDEIHQTLRLPNLGPAEADSKGLTEYNMGDIAKNAIDHWQDYLSSRVGLVKGTAINNAEANGMNNFSVNSGLDKIKEVLGDRVIQDPASGELKLALNIDGLMGQSAKAGLAASQTSAWGDPAGKKVVQELVDKFNVYSASMKVNGGLPLQDLYDSVTYFGDRAAFSEKSPLNGTILSNFKSIRNAFSTDQSSAITSSLEGTSFADTWKQDFTKYSDKIDLIGQFMGKFQNANSAEKISQSILTPKNADTLTKLGQILGKDSPQMDGIRDLWLSGRIDNAIDSSGIFNARSFINDIDPKKWGPEMSSMLIRDSSKLNQLKFAAQQMSQIDTTGFWKVNPDKTIEAAGALTGLWKYPAQAARSLYKLTRNSPEFSDVMAKDGINVLVKAANNDQAVKNIMQGMGIYEAMVDSSARVTLGGRAKQVLVPSAKFAADALGKTVGVGMKNEQMSSQDPNDTDPQLGLGL